MNKSTLKAFATNARKELLKKVEAKAMKIGITEDNIKKAEIESSDAIYIDGQQLSKEEKVQRDRLIGRINQIGFKRVMEEVAYTWFNRFTALRYMEVNEYLPTDVRVLSSTNPNSADPDMVNEALSLDLEIDKEYVYELKLNNKTEELFKYLIIKHCNDLNRYLPFMFETIDDYTEILFPEGLLVKDSFIREMTDCNVIPEDNWMKVEVIGWLYQYYIAEEKDRVFKEKKKYRPEEIPFATQLFTPDWIVRYMVQNSLGHYWIESHPEHSDLLNNWEFYLESSISETKFEEKLTPYINKELNVEDIKCFDPAMGSGHILVYMFDVLYEIYSKCGYMEREIPKLIIENNIYGLDIDDRAYQLACFSVVMKALEYNERFFRSIEREGLKLNLASIQETNNLNEEDIIFIAGEDSGTLYEKISNFINKFQDAKTIGSLIRLDTYEKNFLNERLININNNPPKDLFEEEIRKKVLELLPKLIIQAEIMTTRYDILVTNPPYMGNRYMNEKLSQFLVKEYPDSKLDTFASFMEIDHYLKPFALFSLINQHSWMFISSYEKLRDKILKNKNICSMLHLGTRAFEDIGGEVVQTTAFVLRNGYIPKMTGIFLRLVDFKGAKEKQVKTIEAIQNSRVNYKYICNNESFKQIKGLPIAYWVSERVRGIFDKSISIREIAKPRVGQNTGDNNRFLRQWFEVDFKKIGFNYQSREDALNSYNKWFPYNKGGKFRKWYGNLDYVINWEDDGKEIKDYAVIRNKGKHWSRYIQNLDYIFKEGLTWSDISGSSFGVRYLESGFIFDVTGSMAFPSKEDIYYITAFLCSKISYEFLIMLNPTLHFQTGNIANLPIIFTEDSRIKKRIDDLARINIEICKVDWDSYEISWDFKVHPLLINSGISTIEDSLKLWNESVQGRFKLLKSNEEEINKIFIDIYGLNNEISPVVDEENVIIRREGSESDIKSFISYAVGCIFGRYSLDTEGLIYAGGEFDPNRYKNFSIDKDNIVPILPGAYFEDDVVSKFIDFVKTSFGEDSLHENLDFIAENLGRKKSETAKETIGRYFLNEFFKDHVKTYKKRPIYWLFTSGKQKAFNCLIYMHRYDQTTLSRIRMDYLHEYQIRLDTERKSLVSIIEGHSTTKEISNAKKELKALDKKIEELKDYDELLHHMADMQIEIDLDDGVVVNYEKFQGLVAKI
ncbi:BREX-1 system adenine-specific DNA-methyltransferase PglX [Bacillus massiliglaciei]|uniref:BREX-1 system adenine-specific DNA-methyltransferase PglX n=1 Tax=Bacillus massiliglaciei TaxID=1816693 RepID=UPI000A427672|nr:BREX-1 system adenine-specific DNA-methyltransferase PglX [Bacillus massiliglaciei]